MCAAHEAPKGRRVRSGFPRTVHIYVPWQRGQGEIINPCSVPPNRSERGENRWKSSDNLAIVIFIGWVMRSLCHGIGDDQPNCLGRVDEEDIVGDHFGRVFVLTVEQGYSRIAWGGVPFVCPYQVHPIGRVGVPPGDFMYYGGFGRECLASCTSYPMAIRVGSILLGSVGSCGRSSLRRLFGIWFISQSGSDPAPFLGYPYVLNGFT